MSTIHNPVNFEPSDYEIVAYFDNQRPRYYGQPIEVLEAEIDWWEKELEGAYGPDWIRKIHSCAHCGNVRVRYIVACRHIPSDEVVTFGDICIARLNFANRDEYKIARIRSKAKLEHERLKIYQIYCNFLENSPWIKALAESGEIEKPIHKKNGFALDVWSKLKKYGYLTDKQAAWVFKSLRRDYTIAAEKADRAETEKASEYVGEVGKKTEIMVTIHKEIRCEGMYGVSYLFIMSDSAGNAIRWFNSGHSFIPGEGDTVMVRGTVKKHEEYKGTKQTLLTRVTEVTS